MKPLPIVEAFDSFEAINDLSVSHLPAKRDCLMLFMLHIFIHHISLNLPLLLSDTMMGVLSWIQE
ncbi:unnamed protein product, partial [Brassica rapa]